MIGYDESNDIAVLKIDAEGLAPVISGDSNNLNVDDSVVAIGNPLGELTSGTISSIMNIVKSIIKKGHIASPTSVSVSWMYPPKPKPMASPQVQPFSLLLRTVLLPRQLCKEVM